MIAESQYDGATSLSYSEGEAEPRTKSLVRRSQLEITMEVLSVLMDGPKGPTQLMYQTNTSWSFLSTSLKILIGRGFMRELKIRSRKRYLLTDRGMSIITSYLDILRQLKGTPSALSSSRSGLRVSTHLGG